MPLPEIPYDEWFEDKKPHPHDSMPIARDYDNPRPEEEIADAYQSRHKSTPDHEKEAEEVVTMHEKMYRMATARYNPFHVGASENYHADIEYGGGSEERLTDV